MFPSASVISIKNQPVLAPRLPGPLYVAVSIALLALGYSACGGDAGDGPGPTKVEDQAGRTCDVPFEAREPPTCDKDPMPLVACPSGSTACFQLGTLDVAAQYKPAAICAACCMGDSSTSQSSDCSGIVCEADADCPNRYPSCTSGQCFMKR